MDHRLPDERLYDEQLAGAHNAHERTRSMHLHTEARRLAASRSWSTRRGR